MLPRPAFFEFISSLAAAAVVSLVWRKTRRAARRNATSTSRRPSRRGGAPRLDSRGAAPRDRRHDRQTTDAASWHVA